MGKWMKIGAAVLSMALVAPSTSMAAVTPSRGKVPLFQGRKPALLYKLTPEELPGYGELKSCRVADYTPEWRLKEERKKVQAAKKAASPDAPGQEPPAPPKQYDFEDEPDPSQGVEYQLTDQGQGLGMVELGPDGVVGGTDEDEELPPGR